MNAQLEEKKAWTEIRKKLNQSYDYDDNWEEAILIFKNRLKRKFFDPVQSLVDRKDLKGEGFAIVTVQCALIEMFAAFRKGEIFNYPTNPALNYEYSDSRDLFTRFLVDARIFEDNFWKMDASDRKIKNQPYSAKEFYKNVRCGLMHEARTKGNWHISATPLKKKVKKEKQFIITEDGKIKIYRTVLHYRLLDYLEEYCQELQQDTNDGRVLRKFFGRKLDHLFDIPIDTNFDWWMS